jgi:hypothetical protein
VLHDEIELQHRWIAAPARAGRAPVPLVAPGGELRRVA